MRVNHKVQKNGGNVASHFLTPAGRVIHSVVGPVSADRLLAEARWALDTYRKVEQAPLLRQMQALSWAHQSQMGSAKGNRARQVHELLAVRPLAPLVQIYDEIFRDILGQRISKAVPNLRLANRGLTLARKSGRPLLFVFHNQANNRRGLQDWMEHYARNPYTPALQTLLSEFVVIMMPIREMPALSQIVGQPPYTAPSNARPLFVVARSNGEQLDAVAGWDSDRYLVDALARGCVRVMQENPPSLSRMRRVVRSLKKINHNLADEVRQLAKKTIQERRAA